jgi:hypothetical protein
VRLGRAPLGEREPAVVLGPLVRGGVDDQQQVGASGSGGGDGTALLPEVLADRDRHVDAAHRDDGEAGARDEVAGLVEHPVVGQVVLGVARGDGALVEDGGGVLR